jgi:hypothetical protein
MHLMHMIWLAGHIIGFFHEPSVIVVSTMTILGVILILVCLKVFAHDLFDYTPDD